MMASVPMSAPPEVGSASAEEQHHRQSFTSSTGPIVASPTAHDGQRRHSFGDISLQVIQTPASAAAASKLNGLQRFLKRRPAHVRRELVRRPWEMPVLAMHYAAYLLQQAWLNSWLRKARPSALAARQLHQMLDMQMRSRSSRSSRVGEDIQILTANNKEIAAQMRQRYLDLLRRQCEKDAVVADGASKRHPGYSTFKSFCAALIQGRWRSREMLSICYHVRQYKPLKLYHVAAFEIQSFWRARQQRLREEEEARQAELNSVSYAERRRAAATKLQRAWRCIVDHRVYESLRDTIATFNRSGDPCLLLRSILPREALLLDSAMQVHLRFRLGGHKFPPSIYYKIFTHGTIVDLGSFAPRNYAAQRQLAKFPSAAAAVGEPYCRLENNGWRPLATRVHPTGAKVMDEVEKHSARKLQKNFHFSRLRRRQDLERARRQRTVEWMRKMYGLVVPSTPARVAVGPAGGLGGAARTIATAEAVDNGFQYDQPFDLVPRPPSGGAPSDRAPRPRPRTLRVAADNVSESSTDIASAEVLGAAPVRRELLVTPGRTPPRSAESGDEEEYGAFDLRFENDYFDGMPAVGAYGTGDWPIAATPEEDVSDDALLEWSMKLDFNDYTRNWQRIATSNDSEGTLKLSERPPPARNPMLPPTIPVT